MEFALSDDQLAMQHSLQQALAKACPLDTVRRCAAADDQAFDQGQLPAVDAGLWDMLATLGVPGLLVPEAHGGLGLGLLEAALVAEALGHAAAPLPFLGTAVLAPLALRLAGSPAQQAAWLPRLAQGQVRVGVAITEALSGLRRSEGRNTGVVAHQGRLSGRALFAIDCAGASALLVADTQGGLHLVDPQAEGLVQRPLRPLDMTRPVSELQFERVLAEPLPQASAATLAALRQAAWVVLAADTLGAGSAMLEQAVAYALQRKQFGRLIGSFQAVKHLCAEMAAQLEPSRSLVWYAAHAADALPDDAPLLAAHAKAHLGEVGRFVARTATEVHGGMGITDLLGLHYWFKRIGFSRQLYGGPEAVREHAARLQGLPSLGMAA